MKIAATIIGYIAIAIALMIYQQNTRKRMLFFKAAADTFWVVHYTLLGAYTGAAITVLSTLRSVIFMNKDEKDPKNRIWMFIFIAISITSSILTWGGIFSIFAMGASLTAIVSFYIGNPTLSRILSFPISLCMLTYGAANGSTAVIINESLAMVSAAIGLIRYRKK